jgi:hypothetical protein
MKLWSRVNSAMTYSRSGCKTILESRLLLAAFALTAIVSMVIGVRHTLSSDFDFQWPGAHLLANQVDPWTEALDSHRDLTHSSGVPNYLHELYVLYLPLALLSKQTAGVVWCLVNFVLSFFSILMLGRIYRIPRKHQALLFLIMASSVSFRAGIGAGQLCFAILFLFSLVYSFANSTAIPGLSLGLSFAKYSFAPVISLTFLLKRRLIVLLLAMLPVAIGLCICMWILHKPIFPLAIEPLLVARHGVSPGFADIMTVNEKIERWVPSAFNYPIVLAAAFLYALRLVLKRGLTPGAELACVTVASLLLLKHLIYDYVLLVIPLAYALWGNELKAWARWTVIVVTGYVWFGSALYLARDPLRRALPLLLFNCACMILLLIATDGGSTSEPTGFSWSKDKPKLRGRLRVWESVRNERVNEPVFSPFLRKRDQRTSTN